MKHVWCLVVGAVALGSLMASAARADTLSSTLGQPLREVSHSVDVVIRDGVAVYTVRRVFANAGTIADEAALEIDLPYGAAATGLRIRARTRWHDGELLEREEAARLYEKMTGFGSHRPKDPALLQWLWADKLFLQVFPVFPGAASTVEYTLTVPTRYQRGQVFLSYPHSEVGPGGAVDADIGGTSLPLARPVVTLRPSWADASTAMSVDGRVVLSETPVVLEPPAPPPWADELGISDDGAVLSSIVVPDLDATRVNISAVTIDLDIEHTYRSDLAIALVTPDNQQIAVTGTAGGGDANDIRGRFVVALPTPRPAAGVWRLLVQDLVARDAGTLTAWGLAFHKDAPTVPVSVKTAAPTRPKGAEMVGTVRSPAAPAIPTATSTPATFKVAATDTPLFIPDAPESDRDAGSATFAIAAPGVDVLVARLGKVVASPAHSFSRLEIDVAAELRPLPKQAQLVFVVDASHTMGKEGIAAQIELVRAQVAHVQDADVEIVVYRRHARRLFGRFVKGVDLDAALNAVVADDLAPGNGSALDEGVTLAVKIIDARPGPQHVVLMSDELLRPDFQKGWALDALRALASRAVVHVVVPELNGSDELHLHRDDEAPLSPLAADHHGIFVRIDGLPADQKKLQPVALGLVRPVQIDGFRVRGFDLPAAENDDGDDRDDDSDGTDAALDTATLREGEGRRAMAMVARAADEVVLTGKIWGDRFRRLVKKTEKFSVATAAFVFGEDEHHVLDDTEMMRVALRGRAVSPVTSYLAIEPGVRPSTIGLQRGAGGLGSRGYGLGGGGMGRGSSARRVPPLLKDRVDAEACFAAHGDGAHRVVLAVDTTRDEVVDVKVTEASPGSLGACLAEAVWATRLDEAFNLEREHFVVIWQ